MDQSKPVSPGKFSQLPEDIQARIIRPIAGPVSKTQLGLTIVDRIKDAGTKPFIKDEVEWLTQIRRNIMVFAGYKESEISIKIYATSFSNHSSFAITDSVMMVIKNDIPRYNAYAPGGYSAFYRNYIVKALTNRIDSGIISPEIVDSLTGLDSVDTYLTDLRSVFLILRRRFQIINEDMAVELARKVD